MLFHAAQQKVQIVTSLLPSVDGQTTVTRMTLSAHRAFLCRSQPCSFEVVKQLWHLSHLASLQSQNAAHQAELAVLQVVAVAPSPHCVQVDKQCERLLTAFMLVNATARLARPRCIVSNNSCLAGNFHLCGAQDDGTLGLVLSPADLSVQLLSTCMNILPH